MDEERLIQILIDHQDTMNKTYFESLKRIDDMNRHILIGLVACVVAFCILLGTICVTYFTADYGYLTSNQISNNYSDNNTNQIGRTE